MLIYLQDNGFALERGKIMCQIADSSMKKNGKITCYIADRYLIEDGVPIHYGSIANRMIDYQQVCKNQSELHALLTEICQKDTVIVFNDRDEGLFCVRAWHYSLCFLKRYFSTLETEAHRHRSCVLSTLNRPLHQKSARGLSASAGAFVRNPHVRWPLGAHRAWQWT
jgi:hypothetical protein